MRPSLGTMRPYFVIMRPSLLDALVARWMIHYKDPYLHSDRKENNHMCNPKFGSWMLSVDYTISGYDEIGIGMSCTKSPRTFSSMAWRKTNCRI